MVQMKGLRGPEHREEGILQAHTWSGLVVISFTAKKKKKKIPNWVNPFELRRNTKELLDERVV